MTNLERKRWTTLAIVFATTWIACDEPGRATLRPSKERFLNAPETKPRGAAPNARARLLWTAPDGAKHYALVLVEGDEVASAFSAFANGERLVGAHISAIGAVRDAEVAWFDPARKQYKALTFTEQLEVLSLTGDVVLDPQGKPTVHLHAVLSAHDARALGGHLVHAITSPNLEAFVTAYPTPIRKRSEPGKGFDRIDLAQSE